MITDQINSYSRGHSPPVANVYSLKLLFDAWSILGMGNPIWPIPYSVLPCPYNPFIPLSCFCPGVYRNKAKLDEAWEITCQPYKARNISPGGALTKICLFISVNYAWFTLLVWQNLNIQIIYKLKHVYCFNNIWGLKLL